MDYSFSLHTDYSGSVVVDGQTWENLAHRTSIVLISQSYSQYMTIKESYAYHSASLSSSGDIDDRMPVYAGGYKPFSDYNLPEFTSYITFSGTRIVDEIDGEAFKGTLDSGSAADIIHILHNNLFPTIDITGSLNQFITDQPGVSNVSTQSFKYLPANS